MQLLRTFIDSIYQNFQSASKINSDLDQALKQYYQNVSPSQYFAWVANRKELPFDGISMNQRKVLYATSFKRANLENFGKQSKRLEDKNCNKINNSNLVVNNRRQQTLIQGSNIRNAHIKRSQSKSKVDSGLWINGQRQYRIPIARLNQDNF